MPRGFTEQRFSASGQKISPGYLAQFGVNMISPTLAGAEEITHPYHESWVVYACARLVAEKMASVPLRIYASDAKDAKEVTSGPEFELLRRPNFMQSAWSDVAFADAIHLALCGESIWFLMGPDGRPWDGTKVPSQFLSVMGDAVHDQRDEFGRIFQWQYTTAGASASAAWFSTQQIVHIAELDPADPQRGLGPAEVAHRKLATEFQIERYMEGTTRSGGPGAFIVYEQTMSPETRVGLQDQIDAVHEDPDRTKRLHVLTGNPKVIPNPTTPVDMGLLDQLRYTRNVVCSIMRVPPPCIGILEDAKYANMAEAWTQFWIARAGDLERYARKINAGLFGKLTGPASRYVVRFDTSVIPELQRDNSAKIRQATEIAGADVGPTFGQALEIVGVQVDPKLVTPPDSGDDDAFATDVQDQAMNGAQVASLAEIAGQVARGELNSESAIGILLVAFPNIDEAEARRIIDNAAKTEPPDPEPDVVDDDAVSAKSAARCVLHRTMDAPERRAYWESWNRRVFRRGEAPLRKAVRGFLASYERAQIAKLREFADGAKAMPAGVAKEFTESEVFEVLLDRKRWEKLLDQATASTIKDTFRRSLRELAGELGTRAIPMSDPRVIEALRKQRVQLSEGVTSTLAKQVQRRLVEGLRSSTNTSDLRTAIKETLPELEGSLREAFQTKDQRAQAIARTETAHASNVARFEQMAEDNVTRHQWSAEPDDATRPEHAQLDGEVRSVGEVFGYGLKFPSDPAAPAAMVINCRCVAVPVVE